ncbi:glucose-fructose oxidoreductase [Halarchaeum grantii]|uniref:Glucose-fructose oxidoreductase n=1 Tax=Halarchaeum grantii TaxID=1193105 RepID=A0A830F474_9EURY|nr:D-xylose 1-dehydrogenase Gfo6 [Halarchaeum grantii]GGL38757.1 glucose-fructose oxidoreductase [Halarchaeum grantii]
METATAFDRFRDGYEERDWDDGADGTVRIALVGLGWFARDEALPAIADCDYADVTATISGSAEKARTVADEAGADTALTYERFHDGEGSDAYDAVYVATPNARHLEYVETAAELGKDVICEKPMEATVERAEAMVDACEAAGVTLMVAYRMQADPVMRRVRELVADGFVGDVAQAGGTFAFPMFANEDADPDQWRLDPDLAGGGSLYDIGVYPLNTLRFVLDADPTSVQGSLTSPDERFDGPVIDEHAAFLLEFDGGVQALCRSSYGSHGESSLRIDGNEGAITVENAFSPRGERTVVLERDGRRSRHEGLGSNELTEQFDYFAYCRLTGRTPTADGEHGLVDMQALDGIQTAAAGGRRVDLD